MALLKLSADARSFCRRTTVLMTLPGRSGLGEPVVLRAQSPRARKARRAPAPLPPMDLTRQPGSAEDLNALEASFKDQ